MLILIFLIVFVWQKLIKRCILCLNSIIKYVRLPPSTCALRFIIDNVCEARFSYKWTLPEVTLEFDIFHADIWLCRVLFTFFVTHWRCIGSVRIRGLPPGYSRTCNFCFRTRSESQFLCFVEIFRVVRNIFPFRYKRASESVHYCFAITDTVGRSRKTYRTVGASARDENSLYVVHTEYLESTAARH